MSPLRKIYLSLIFFALTYFLLIFFFLLPIFGAIKKTSLDFQSAKDKFNSLTFQEKQKSVLENLYKNHQSDLEKIEQVFIDPDLPLDFINFLEEIARSSQVQLVVSSMIKKEVKDDPWPSLFLQISITGPFPNFLQFLEKLKNGPYLVEVLDLMAQKLTEKEEKAEKNVLAETNVNLSLKVFTR